MPNENNLIPIRTESEARKNGSKGGKNQAKSAGVKRL